MFEDLVGGLSGMLRDIVGPKGPSYLPLVGTIGAFILVSNLIGLVPGFMAPTSSINVTLGCALTVWVYYHYPGRPGAGPRRVPEALRGTARRAAVHRADHAAD